MTTTTSAAAWTTWTRPLANLHLGQVPPNIGILSKNPKKERRNAIEKKERNTRRRSKRACTKGAKPFRKAGEKRQTKTKAGGARNQTLKEPYIGPRLGFI